MEPSRVLPSQLQTGNEKDACFLYSIMFFSVLSYKYNLKGLFNFKIPLSLYDFDNCT